MIEAISVECRSLRNNKTFLTLSLVYWLALIGLFVYVQTSAGPYMRPWGLLWLLAIVILSFAPLVPSIGPFVYLFVAYSVPRYSPPSFLLSTLALPEWIAYVALGAFALRVVAGRATFRLGGYSGYLMLALWSILAVSALHARWIGSPWEPLGDNPLLRDPMGKFNQALILFFLGVNLLSNRSGFVGVAVTLLGTLIVRCLFGGTAIQGDHDIAFLIAMLLPFILSLSLLAWPRRLIDGAIIVAALPPLALLILTRNRAGLVGVAAAALVVWLRSETKVVSLVLVSCLLVGLSFLVPPQAYLQRFATAGADQSSEGRLNVWRAAINMVSEHPLLGIGVGNFGAESLNYGENPIMGQLAAHNNFLHMAGEGGLLALGAYVALILATLVCAAKLCRTPIPWLRTTGRILEASIVGYLLAGLFVSRHNLALAYLIMGLAAGLRYSYFIEGKGPMYPV